MQYPANGWREGLPVGNGSLGALVYGRLAREVILLNHEWLWYGAMTPPVPDISGHLPKLRDLLLTKRYAEAQSFYAERLQEAGYVSGVARYQPGPDLIIQEEIDGGFTHYTRTLDFEKSEATVSWLESGQQGERNIFVSRPDQMLVVRCHGIPGQTKRRKISLRPHELLDAIDFGGKPLDIVIEGRSWSVDGCLGMIGHIGDDCRWAAAVRVIASGSEVRLNENSIDVSGAGDVLILVALVPGVGEDSEIATLAGELNRKATDYDTLLATHMREHQPLFNSAKLDLKCRDDQRQSSNELLLLEAYQGTLPLALAEKIHDFGRYLLICSSRSGGLPANLQGLWNGDYLPPWNGAYFNNENIQISYWQALPGNMPETVLPIFDLYEKLLPDFRENARKFFGCRGIALPLYLSPDSGLKRDQQAHALYWTGGAAWIAQIYFDYWLFTQDREFLRDRALPFLREVAAFYEDFLVEDETGQYQMLPSNSPENFPIGDTWETETISVCINATMDFALLREVLTNLQLGSQALGLDESDLNKWRAMETKIPPYQINADGALKEWMHPDFQDNYLHRHQSHIYPLFPGLEITDESNPAIFQAGVKAVEKRLLIGLASQSGWSLAHMANNYARLGEGERALECLALLSRSCLGASLMMYHNDFRDMGISLELIWGRTAPLQLDANFGSTAAFSEMLIQSRIGSIKLLPALPPQWARGEMTGLMCRGGITVDLSWDVPSGIITAALTAISDISIRLTVPKGFALYGRSARAEIILPAQTREVFEFRSSLPLEK